MVAFFSSRMTSEGERAVVLKRGRFGAFVLALAATALCLGLLFTTPSDAQTRAESQNARSAVGDEDCIAFENEPADETGSNEDTQSDTADTEGDAADQSSLQDGDEGDTTGDQALQSEDGIADRQTQDEGSDANLQGQQVQSQNQSSLRVRNDNSGDFQQSLQTDENDALPQSLEDGNGEEEDNTSLSSQDEDYTNGDTVDDQASQNGDEDDGDTNGNGDSEQQQTQDENGDEGDECVIAETVPDEPLLPTGAPARSGSNATAKNKSGSEKQGKTGGETERKAEDKTVEKQADSAGKRTGGGKKLEVQDRGKKIEVEDRSGKTPRQEKSGSRTKPASLNEASPEDARLEKARPASSSENPLLESARSESARSEPSRARSDRPDPGRAEPSRAESMRTSDLAPRLAAAEWSSPSREEVDLTEGPRRFAPDPGAEMTLSARTLRLHNVPVANSNRLEELDRGLVRMPDTSLPWDTGDQRNVFVAGHYLGLPETQSRMVFYNLDKLKSGDEIVLKDSLGQAYKYRVSEKFAAGPEDSWVMGQVRGRDMLTLQTCIPPDFGKRLVVRADRVQ